MSHTRMSAMVQRILCFIPFYQVWNAWIHCTGWRRCIECLKLQVSFRKRATNHMALLKKKMTYMPQHTTGLRRNIECLKLQISFCTWAIKYGALLRKVTYKNKTSYGSLPPLRVVKKHRLPYKLQVSFRIRAIKYGALLWKMPYKDKASIGSSPLLLVAKMHRIP